MPQSWAIARATTSALALLLGLILLLGWMTARGSPPAVVAYSVGAVVGIVIIMTTSLLWNLAAPAHLRTKSGTRLSAFATFAAVTATLVPGYIALSHAAGSEGWQTTDIVMGAVIMLATQIVWSLIRLIPREAAKRVAAAG
ncbi:hypothetical protein [Arthrobacter sp. ISL-69]|uniref:hypothetical protein n=1 Tax=Arthrobacter sp. ISL-69 TaxID=2819113 RepID=UPI001BECDD4D|nr:hypothetical protein [Arthrobacter sp. ISL-69]MBT2538943.1 hypothetical protein [Arthrobacter sp. ISL-69]